MPRMASIYAIVLGVSSALSCRPSETRRNRAVAVPVPLGKRAASLDRTIVSQVIASPGGDGLVLIGQRRAPDTMLPRAWVAMLGPEGDLIWESVVREGAGLAERVVVDRNGNIHVFGRDFAEGAWLLSLDATGQRLASAPLPIGPLFAMRATGDTLELWGRSASPQDEPGRSSLLWVVWDPAQSSTPTSTLVAQSAISLDEEAAPEIEIIGPGMVWMSSLEYRVATDTTAPEAALVKMTIAELEALPEEEEPVITTLVPRQVASIALGGSELFVLQMPPSGGHDARLEVARHRAPLDTMAKDPTDLSLWEASETQPWQWLGLVLGAKERASLASYRTALESGRCDLIDLDGDCDLKRFTQLPPSFYAPQDACWRYFEARNYLEESSAEDFVPRVAAWLALLEPLYFRGRSFGIPDAEDYKVEDSLREDIFAAALRHGQAEAVVTFLLELEDDYATADAVGLLKELDPKPSEPLVRRLVEGFRNDPGRCDTIRQLLPLIQAPPRWEADTADECDVLYVLCAGLQPDLATQIIPKGGIVFERTCDDSRVAPTEAGLTPCTPERWVDTGVDSDAIFDPMISATCGTNASHLDHRYTCGASIELESVTLEFGAGPTGRVLTKVEYFETAGF